VALLGGRTSKFSQRKELRREYKITQKYYGEFQKKAEFLRERNQQAGRKKNEKKGS